MGTYAKGRLMIKIEIEKIKELDRINNYLKILKVSGLTMTKEQAEAEIKLIEARLRELRDSKRCDDHINYHN